MNNQELGWSATLFTVFLCFLFGSNAVAIKISLSGIGVFTNAGVRFGLATIAIGLWAWSSGRSFRLQEGQALQLLIVSAIFTLQLSLFHLGVSKTNASRTVLLSNLQPFFTLFLAHFFISGDRISWRKILGIVMGFSGVVFVFAETTSVSAEIRSGDLIILVTAFVWACNAVYVKRIIGNFRAFHTVFYPMMLSVPIFFLLAWSTREVMFFNLTPDVLGALFYQSFVSASFGFVAWNTMLQRYGAVALHSFLFIMPIAGVLLGGLLLKEPITTNITVALILIASGILIVQLKPGAVKFKIS